MLSNFLIKDKFEEFDLVNKDSKSKFTTNLLNIQEKEQKQSNTNNDFVENIDETNYYIKDNDIIYKIFEDVSSIEKNDKYFELILELPVQNNIISINKIKLSEQIKKYILDVWVGEKIKKKTKKKIIASKKIFSDKNLHILLKNDALEHIINKNIFVNYSYAIYKNKQKFFPQIIFPSNYF